MKIKQIYAASINTKNIKKVILVRECSTFKQAIKIALQSDNDEFKSVFTSKSYFFDKRNLVPFEFLLMGTELKETISKQQLLDYYLTNYDEIAKKMDNQNNQIGFERK